MRITNASEMYNALTDEKQLALVLDEGLDPEYLQRKDQMIEYFCSIRNRINVEDLPDFLLWSNREIEHLFHMRWIR